MNIVALGQRGQRFRDFMYLIIPLEIGRTAERPSKFPAQLKGIGEPFPACNVAYELVREREKGNEMTSKSDENESGTT